MTQHYTQLANSGDLYQTAKLLRDRFGLSDAERKLADLIQQNCGGFGAMDRKKGPWLLEAARCVLKYCEIELRGDGQSACAVEAKSFAPDTPQPNDDANGQLAPAHKASRIAPDASSLNIASLSDARKNDDSNGHESFAEKASDSVPAQSSPTDDGNGHSGGADEAIYVSPAPSSPNSSGGGLVVSAAKANGHLPISAASQRDAAGHSICADEAMSALPNRIAPEGDGTGQKRAAEKAMLDVPRSVAPSVTRLRSMFETEKKAAQTILDTFIIDKRPIGDWTILEAIEASTRKLEEGFILRAVTKHAPNTDPRYRVRDIMSAETFQRIMKEAKEFADAA